MQADIPRPQRSVLLVPGLGGVLWILPLNYFKQCVLGSILRIRNRNTYETHQLWPRLSKLDTMANKFMKGKFNPNTLETESSEKDWDIYAPDDNFGLFACDLLMPKSYMPIQMHCYFHVISQMLQKNGYVPGVTLWGCPYDWRQHLPNPQMMHKLQNRIEDAYYSSTNEELIQPSLQPSINVTDDDEDQQSDLQTKVRSEKIQAAQHWLWKEGKKRRKRKGRKIDCITHSLGGLYLRTFIALNPVFARKHIRRWIAITTPWQGASRHIYALMRGYAFGMPSFMVQDKSMWEMAQRGIGNFPFLIPQTLPFSPKLGIRILLNGNQGLNNIGDNNTRSNYEKDEQKMNMNNTTKEDQKQSEDPWKQMIKKYEGNPNPSSNSNPSSNLSPPPDTNTNQQQNERWSEWKWFGYHIDQEGRCFDYDCIDVVHGNTLHFPFVYPSIRVPKSLFIRKLNSSSFLFSSFVSRIYDPDGPEPTSSWFIRQMPYRTPIPQQIDLRSIQPLPRLQNGLDLSRWGMPSPLMLSTGPQQLALEQQQSQTNNPDHHQQIQQISTVTSNLVAADISRLSPFRLPQGDSALFNNYQQGQQGITQQQHTQPFWQQNQVQSNINPSDYTNPNANQYPQIIHTHSQAPQQQYLQSTPMQQPPLPNPLHSTRDVKSASYASRPERREPFNFNQWY
ncbi:MAG: hypothetical protein EZS28_014051 [Streblomastix strix]|uniref:Uncharacterized protein n=1 Tax=Streblomastix strix TaxID=222440 RepID=A0A5J4W700_9EUKA|nr:MAG: hypothetical protein EZS28_014051 [Streblomastix strix]